MVVVDVLDPQDMATNNIIDIIHTVVVVDHHPTEDGIDSMPTPHSIK